MTMTKKWRRDDDEGLGIDEIDVDRSTDGTTATEDGSNESISSVDRPSVLNNGTTKGMKESSMSSWPVSLYIPNLLGYLRIVLSFWGLKFALQQQCHNALNLWITASLLDFLDGIAARTLNQSSQFGIFLDIIADNVLRSIVWISATLESSKSDPGRENEICTWAIVIVCLEWITMFCSQSNLNEKNQKGGQKVHWKNVERKAAEAESNRSPPFWVQAVFKNNFRSLPGIFAIYGLFVAPLGTYVRYADQLHKTTWSSKLLSEYNISILIKTSYAGRFLSAMVELWLCYDFFRGIIARDSSQHRKQKES